MLIFFEKRNQSMMFTCKIIASYNRQFSADSTMNDYKIDSCFVVALGPKNRVTKT